MSDAMARRQCRRARLYLSYISAISRLYLGYISAISRLYGAQTVPTCAARARSVQPRRTAAAAVGELASALGSRRTCDRKSTGCYARISAGVRRRWRMRRSGCRM